MVRNMDNKDIKIEINKIIETIPENVLGEVLKYLKEVQGQSKEKIELSKNLRKIINEDKNLLRRLTQ
jgi:hypothetical protein